MKQYEQPPVCYLADDVTVGELVRWINSEVVKAGRCLDMDMLRAMVRLGEGVESALDIYRAEHHMERISNNT